MQAELTDKKDIEATIRVTVPADEVDRAYESVLRSLARQVKVPGFRPGKAPRGVLVKRIGEDALGQEVRDALVDANYPKAVEQFGLTPVHAHFHADEPSEGSDYQFEIHMDLYPSVELPDVSGIVIDTERQRVGDDLVEETVERLRREHAALVPVDRPIRPGDQVWIETLGEGDEPAGAMPVELDEADDEVAEQFLGHGIGDEFTLALAKSEGAGEDEEAPTVQVRVTDVKERDLPDADDAFAATLGLDDWEAALAEIRRSLQSQLDQEIFESQREEFIDKLLVETDFDVPKSLVTSRQRSMLANVAADLERRNLTLQGYLESLEGDGRREEFERELAEGAERAVRRDLVLEKLLEERGTTVEDEEFDALVRYMASSRGQDPGRFRREQGERWLAERRFLMARDKAVRDAVRELVGDDEGVVASPAALRAVEEAVDAVEAAAGPAGGDGGEPDEAAADDAERDRE